MTIFNKEITKLVRNDALEMEKRGNVSPQILDYLYEEGLFKLLVPKQFGGKMTTLPEGLNIYEEAAYIEGNFGWLVTICSGNAYAAKIMPPTLYEEKLSNKKSAVSLSGFPSGKAKKVDGGYNVSGEWKFCSGSSFVTLFLVNCIIEKEEDAEEQESRTIMFERNQVNVLNDWNAFGMKATNSNTIVVENVFIPDNMTMPFDISTSHYDNHLLNYPFFQFAKAQFASMCLGIARHFIEESSNLLKTYKVAWSKSDKYQFVSDKITSAEDELTETKSHFYERMQDAWNTHVNGRQFTDDYKVELNTLSEDVARKAMKIADSIFPYLGINAVLEDTEINKIYRDLQTASHHGLIVSYRD